MNSGMNPFCNLALLGHICPISQPLSHQRREETNDVDRVHQLPWEIEEEFGFLKYSQSRPEFLGFDCVLEDGQEHLVRSMARDYYLAF